MRALAIALSLGGCAAIPLAPDPRIDPRGKWTVVAVNDVPTGGGTAYRFVIAPPAGSAQFGCNDGSGALRVDRGWIVPGDWIITVAGCRNKATARLERRGFAIIAKPMAVERHGNGIRLRNDQGAIELTPLPAPTR